MYVARQACVVRAVLAHISDIYMELSLVPLSIMPIEVERVKLHRRAARTFAEGSLGIPEVAFSRRVQLLITPELILPSDHPNGSENLDMKLDRATHS